MPKLQEISVALTGEQVDALQSAVHAGEYDSPSEIVQEALVEWQRRRELNGQDLARLRELWREGSASGSAEPLDFAEVREEARRRLNENTRKTA